MITLERQQARRIAVRAQLLDAYRPVFAVHEDSPFTPEVADAVDGEVHRLAEWLGLEVAG